MMFFGGYFSGDALDGYSLGDFFGGSFLGMRLEDSLLRLLLKDALERNFWANALRDSLSSEEWEERAAEDTLTGADSAHIPKKRRG